VSDLDDACLHGGQPIRRDRLRPGIRRQDGRRSTRPRVVIRGRANHVAGFVWVVVSMVSVEISQPLQGRCDTPQRGENRQTQSIGLLAEDACPPASPFSSRLRPAAPPTACPMRNSSGNWPTVTSSLGWHRPNGTHVHGRLLCGTGLAHCRLRTLKPF
jgi:hypothetical protein